MGRTLIKICGVTRVEDALAAARFGADFVGMVLHADSPRTIPADAAREIVRALPDSIVPVALFVDAPPRVALETCRRIGITHVQLHGHETPAYAAAVSPLVSWKMIRVNEHLPDELRAWSNSRVNAIVLETASTGADGGSGRENDWDLIAQSRGLLDTAPNFIAAGGLTPDNVADVVPLLRPWAVDVSSGVEGATKGVKSHEKIESFIRAVRAADESA